MRTRYQIARQGGSHALRVGNLAWDINREHRRAAVMKLWADRHGYVYAPTCDLPPTWRGQGQGLHHVVGAVNGHRTSIFDIKDRVGAGPRTQLVSVVVLTVDGDMPVQRDTPREGEGVIPFQWRVEDHKVIAWWEGTVAPINMWAGANTLAENLGLTRRRLVVPVPARVPHTLVDSAGSDNVLAGATAS